VLPQKVQFIRQLLYKGKIMISFPIALNFYANAEPFVVVYVHCGHGQDRFDCAFVVLIRLLISQLRTGEMTGSYELEFKLKNFQRIWKYDTDIQHFNVDELFLFRSLKLLQTWEWMWLQMRTRCCGTVNIML
jgi:hypothetical protein